MTGHPPGPFETSDEALLALRPTDGSFTSRDDRLELLQDTMRAAGVELGEWDLVVLRWLADLDIQTVAAVAGWVQRARPVSGEVIERTAAAAVLADYKAAVASAPVTRPPGREWMLRLASALEDLLAVLDDGAGSQP